MAELWVVRHGQASFGADDYDQLSDVGAEQSAALGGMLRERGWQPDRVLTGTLSRQHQTLEAMGFGPAEAAHPGFNEYDFHDLLRTRFGDSMPVGVTQDRKTHFRALRETLRIWQDGGLEGARESWVDFKTRIEDARALACAAGAKRVLVISSGGVIGRLTAAAVHAPNDQMIALNLQVKNTSITRFVFTPRAFFLHEFNATPHLDTPQMRHLLTYS